MQGLWATIVVAALAFSAVSLVRSCAGPDTRHQLPAMREELSEISRRLGIVPMNDMATISKPEVSSVTLNFEATSQRNLLASIDSAAKAIGYFQPRQSSEVSRVFLCSRRDEMRTLEASAIDGVIVLNIAAYQNPSPFCRAANESYAP